MLIYTTTEIRNGAWHTAQRFVRADDAELLSALGQARALMVRVTRNVALRLATVASLEQILRALDANYLLRLTHAERFERETPSSEPVPGRLANFAVTMDEDQRDAIVDALELWLCEQSKAPNPTFRQQMGAEKMNAYKEYLKLF